MGYRKYAKDYEIEYVSRLDRKKPKAVRIYVGPYFRFSAPPERIRVLKWRYLAGIVLLFAVLLVPLCIDCLFTRTWFIQLPAVAAWIPFVLAAASVWRLWTAGEKVEREHYDLMYQRLCGSLLFLMAFGAVSLAGCAALLFRETRGAEDLVVLFCYIAQLVCGAVLFSWRKGLVMDEVENPEKPQVKSK